MTGGSMHLSGPGPLARAERIALGAGVAGLVASAAGWAMDAGSFFESWLIAFLFWSGFALGSLALLMLQHMTGGNWGLAIRRILEASTRTLPLVAVLFVPLLFGLERLFPWARPGTVAGDELLEHKAPYLNPAFFTARLVIYFAVWILLSWVLNAWSARQDERPDASYIRKFQLLSGPGLVLFVLLGTFASTDWAMSLEPHWFSTIYGPLFMAGQVLAAMAFSIAIVAVLAKQEPLSRYVTKSEFHDLGKLLFTFVLLWAYFAFSQLLIIWAGNLPEEIPWYLKRFRGGWQWAGIALLVFEFAMPFVLLLSRTLKRSTVPLSRVAIVVLLAHLLDVYWMIGPAFRESLGAFRWTDLAAVAGIGGLWVHFFLRKLKERPLMPIGDPFAADLMRRADA